MAATHVTISAAVECTSADSADLPSGWRLSTVRDIASHLPNATVGGPFGSELLAADYVHVGVPVIRGQNMSGPYVGGEFVYVTEKKARALSANTARPGDLVFTQRGTLGQVALVPAGEFPTYLISQSQMKLSPDKARVVPEYLLHWFLSPFGQQTILNSAIQTGVPHTNLGILRSYELPIPPLTEQLVIAEALSDIDRLIQSLEMTINKKRAIKQGAMQELLSGKRRMPGFSGEWRTERLEYLGDVLNGLTYSPADVSETGTLVLRSSNIQNDVLSFDDNVFVRVEVPQQSIVRTNDILICVRNGSRDLIGKCAKLDERCAGMAFGAFMVVFRTTLHDFILQQVRSGFLKKQISEHLGATINQITNKSLKSFVIPMPPTEDEALAVSQVLNDMDREIDLLNAKLSKTRQIKQGMMRDLLTGRVRLV